MNAIYIGHSTTFSKQTTFFNVQFDQAGKYLQLLRSDYFDKVVISLPQNVIDKQLKFIMYLSRILKQKGQIHINNSIHTNQYKVFANLAAKLGLYQNKTNQNTLFYTKQKIQSVKIDPSVEVKKTSIGFKPIQNEEIDQDELMKSENLSIEKQKVQNCAQKPRACANCNCGRKSNQTPLVPKQKLIESINQGKPVSGCGKCFLGDSFRCGSCPYKGLPAFKPGDKLKMMEEGQVVVEANQVKVQSGKVKIQL